MIKSNQGELILSGSYRMLFSELGSIIIGLKEMISSAEGEERELAINILETDILFAFMAKGQDDYMQLTKFDSPTKLRLLRKEIFRSVWVLIAVL